MFADVIVDITSSEVDKIFEYSFSDDRIVAGSRVAVPFGAKNLCGIVTSIKSVSEYPASKIKPISKLLDEVPALTAESLALVNYIKKRYFVTTASALRLFLPTEMRLGKVKELLVSYAELSIDDSEVDNAIYTLKTTAKQQALSVIQLIRKQLSILHTELRLKH